MHQVGVGIKARVRVLDPRVAEKIAAGEVIERPASVVKELVENSLDAGATEIAIVLSDGGKSLIEIIDNGCGMFREDLALAIERHATSKIRELDDLDRLQTLGFRGEALPSIAAVSELSIVSRAEGTETAHELRASNRGARPEPVTFGHFLGTDHGTRIRCEGLFSQVPARLKFLKSQGAEVSQVREWVERLGLINPSVGFRLVSEDRTVLNLRPQSEESRVSAILSDGEEYPVAQARKERDGITVQAYWLQGLSTPQTRRLVQVINRRAVRDRTIQQAVLAPFRQTLLPGQFPAVAVFIEVDPASIDVNVHPTKAEVRFLDSRRVFQTVSSTLEEMIAVHGAPAYVPGFSTQQDVPIFPTSNEPAAVWRASAPDVFAPKPATPVFQTAQNLPLELGPSAPDHPFASGKYLGILFNTYLIYDLGEELGAIDQHAAHERIRFEELRRRALCKDQTGEPQPLLIPEAARFPADQRELMEARLPWLAQLGFEAELFGDDQVLFRGVPAEWGTDSLKTRLKGLIDRALSADSPKGESVKMDEVLFEKLASEACHSAIRAGDRLMKEECDALLGQLFRCEHPWNCPHGRPTVLRVPRSRFEEWFQRRV